MRQTIASDANTALLEANLPWPCAAIQALGAARLSVVTAHYTVTERVLANVGLVLVDVVKDDYITLARIVRVKA